MKSQNGYWKAIGHRYDIHQAVATAAPYSISVLAYATSFLYNQGILCYRARHEIRLLDVHAGGKQERVLNLFTAFQLIDLEPPALDAVERVSLVQYSDGILVFRVNAGIDLANDQTDDDQVDLLSVFDFAGRLKTFTIQIPTTAQVFVRHSRTYLWYGLFGTRFDERTERPISEWTIYGVDMASTTHHSTEFCRLRAMDSVLGQSVCFEMYNEHLYAVSTQTVLRDEIIYSWFYHVFCCVPRDKPRCWNGHLWRRETYEGPINDLWADLSIRVDEITGRPVILECRREWSHGTTENHRTYYTQLLPLSEDCLTVQGERDMNNLAWIDPPELQDIGYNSNAQRPNQRLPDEFHAEYESIDSERREFMFSSTKYHTYNPANSTFIDLVNDSGLLPNGFRSLDPLRIRTISRKPKCPIDVEGTEGEKNLLFRPKQHDEDHSPIEGSEKRFVSCGVYMWPPHDGPVKLFRLLCPGVRNGAVHAISDDRSIICSIQYPNLAEGHRALVLINFDPQIRFPFLSSLRDIETCSDVDKALSFEVPKPEILDEDLFRAARPLHESIGLGYWLR